MADPPRDPDPSYLVDVVPDHESTAGAPTATRPTTPRWVTVSWSITLAVIVVFVIALVTKGPHRPGSHESLGSAISGRPPVTVSSSHMSAVSSGPFNGGLG